MKNIFKKKKQYHIHLAEKILIKTRVPFFLLVLLGLLMLPACSGYQVAGNLLVCDKNALASYEENIIPEKADVHLAEPTPEWPKEVSEEELLNPENEIDIILQGLDVPEGCDVKLDPEFENKILEMINEERINKGLLPLSMNEKLLKAARQHSVDMACKNYFNHTDLDGNSYDERVLEQGYQFAAVGENIYAGDNRYNCPEQAYKAWYRSQRHYQVMFHSMVTEIGIGYAYNPESRHGGYFTADFAKPVADSEY